MTTGSPDVACELERRRFLRALGLSVGAVALGGLAACTDDDEGGSGPTASTTTSSSDGDPPPTDPLVEAFFAGVPLVVTMRTLQTFAPVTGINELFRTAALTTADTRLVVAPNHDTLYALSVLDLSAGPVVISMPDESERYHVIQVLDAWMGAVGFLGTRATEGRAGRWAMVGPGFDGELPAEVERLDCPTPHAFILGRIRATEDLADQAAAAEVGQAIALAPLEPDAVPADLGPPLGAPQDVGTNGAEFFTELAGFLALDPPTTDAQRAALADLDRLVAEASDEDLAAAVAIGLDALAAGADDTGEVINGWRVALELGRNDDALSLRDQAVVARYFWGPVPAEEALYPKAEVAADGEPLDGSKRYRVTFPGDDLPPVDAFWSLTAYAEDLFLYPNDQDRWSFSGDTPDLVRASDGTITIAVQHDDPRDATVNWLPVPDTPFHLIMRLYLPGAGIVDGSYQYPEIQVI
jgi:hypothetical protein